jgi:hypothetical protein
VKRARRIPRKPDRDSSVAAWTEWAEWLLFGTLVDMSRDQPKRPLWNIPQASWLFHDAAIRKAIGAKDHPTLERAVFAFYAALLTNDGRGMPSPH